MDEVWKPISGYEGRYQVSNLGRVRRVGRIRRFSDEIRILKPERGKYGHCRVQLCMNGTKKRALVHRLVALAFIGPAPAGYEVNHIDFNPINNRVDNLEWVTHQQNILHSKDRLVKTIGESHGMCKLTAQQVNEIKTRYARGGISFAKLAKDYNICAQECHRIVRGTRWASL